MTDVYRRYYSATDDESQLLDFSDEDSPISEFWFEAWLDEPELDTVPSEQA